MPMSSILVSVFPAKTSIEQLHDRLRELSDQKQIQRLSEFIISHIGNKEVKQCVVGPNHIAFLLDDQRICRLRFTLNEEKIDQTPKDDGNEETSCAPSRSIVNAIVHSAARSNRSDLPFTFSGDTLTTLSGQLGRWGSPRTVTSAGTANRPSTTVAGSTASPSGGIRVRGRIVRAAMRGRSGNSWLSSRPVIPASAVPEELVAQAQVVLQGKSRNIIVRELQRTNLDVNLAVNNLLSRDDDETDEHDDGSEAYIPGDDLISIFNGEDSSFVVDPDSIFPEDIIYGSSLNRPVSRTGRRTASNEGNSRAPGRDHDVDATVSQCEKYYLDLLNIDQSGSKLNKPNKSNEKMKSSLAGEAVCVVGDVEFWKADAENNDSSMRFSHIASLHSELVAVSLDGKLHQWKWSEATPVKAIPGQHSHSRAADMKLKDEKIASLAACNIRASVMTESGKIATWLDETLSAVAFKLEHPAQLFAEFRNQTVTGLHVCDLYSCVQLNNGSLFWWGVFPFEQRRKLMDKVKQKAKKNAISGSSLIQAGTQVCLRSSPLYYPGAVGFLTLNGQPKVGELLEQAWTITEKCRFKILKNGKKDREGEATAKVTEKSEYGEPTEISKKRKRFGEDDDNADRSTEEHWNLRDVIFVEDVRNVPVGKVLKVDGAYALVNFSDVNSANDAPSDDLSLVLKSCRLVRKDELQIVRWTTPPKMSECFQKVPKQLSVPGNCRVLSVALDANGVHTLLKSPTTTRYAVFSLASGRVEPGGTIPPEAAAVLTSPSSGIPSLYTAGMDSLVVLSDGNGCIFPLVRDCIGGIKDPTWVNLCPMSCLSMGCQTFQSGSTTNHVIMAVIVVRNQSLMKSVGSCNIEKIKEYLQYLEQDPALAEKVLNEKCDGNRNLIHKAVSCCFPSSATRKSQVAPKPTDKDFLAQANLAKSLDLTQRTNPSDMDDIFPLDLPIPTASWPPEQTPLVDQTSDHNDDHSSKWVPVGEKSDGLSCLNFIVNHPVLANSLINLLKEKDATGCTPFMSAVRGRAYSAALALFNAAKKHASKDEKLDQDLFMSMIFPLSDSHLSPFHTICCNDTCSFTWTGTTHINQDIFECRTCGLVGTLCCCTECARVCHIGHDCKLKRTSPTAYCDCWEKCACKALIPGEQESRVELLKKLLSETDLATKPNKEGEHILLFLAKTVARQSSEQGQYISNKSSDSKSRSANLRSMGTPVLPAHDLEPPKFAKLALEHTLKNWRALRSMLVFGSSIDQLELRTQAVDESFANMIGSSILSPEEKTRYLKSQEGTARLDSFVRCLLVKCNIEYLKTLLKTLETVIADAKEKNDADPLLVARRFVRSVCRVFVVLSSSLGPSSSKKKSSPSLTPLMRCKRVFTSLNVIAVKELACIADAVFAPVRLGVVYPSAPFTLLSFVSDASLACDDLFSVLPLPSRTGTESSRGHHVRFENAPPEREEEPSQSDRAGEIEMDILTQEEHSSSGMAIDSQEPPMGNDAEEIHNAESDMEIDLLAESESDSDDSNADDVEDNQRSNAANVATNRQGHSRSGMDENRRSHDNENVDYLSGQESVTDLDDDEDGDGEIEDDADTVYESAIEPIVHRLISSSNRTPHALQWAVRNLQRQGGSVEANSHGYGATANIRRGGSGASASADVSNGGNHLYSMPSALARTFAIVVRELADILALSSDEQVSYCIPLKQTDLAKARCSADAMLGDTWQWLWRVMETTETQLRFGASLTAVSDPTHPHHPLHDVQMKKGDRRRETNSLLSVARNWHPDPKRKRRNGNGSEASDSSLRHDFLTYLLSLMRGSDNEHGDSLPKLEVTSLQHVAYILDAFVYYLRSKTNMNAEHAKQDGPMFANLMLNYAEAQRCSASKSVAEDSEEESETDEEVLEDKDTRMSLNRFFKRSDSTLVLGYEASDPFSVPMREALPLANKPHLLNPTARRDQLFGSTRNTNNELEADIPQCIGYGAPLSGGIESTPSSSSNSRLVPEMSKVSANCILGRWRMCLELFGRLFLDDVGIEPNSVLNEIGRFDVKEAKFRRDMEKLRNNHQKDLYIEEVERDRVQLIKQTFRKLDSFFGRRGHSSVPVNIHRLRVSFKDEPGEGSGVVRSFYTAIGEALLSEEPLPPLDAICSGTTKDEGHAGLVLLAGLTQRLKSRVRERERRRGPATPGSGGMVLTARMRREREHAKLVMEREGTQKLNPDAKPYEYDPDLPDVSDNDEGDDGDPIKRAYLGRRLYSRVHSQQPALASQITGMLLELSPTQIIWLLTQEEFLKTRIAQAVELLNAKEKADPTSAGSSQDSLADKSNSLDDDDYDDYLDNSPLFFQPGKTGFYSPRCGKISVERLSCYRNVGRLIGLCLLQNELSPISFNRHVIKYILGREVSWHDLAFFDPNLYEVLRLLIQDSVKPDAKELFTGLDLTFCIELSQKEGGVSKELVPNGKQKTVTPDSIQDYVKRYAEYRMITVAKKPLESLRRGVLDVLPAHTLEGLTAEDFRLLLNGSGNINVQQLISYTSFSDETGGDSQDKLSKFKRWFWSIVESMTLKQKQDMLYFWTSSPAMPASSEGFQPMPSVTVKPANDHQLPTANTCISRLYIPLYSSKSILKSKILLAIKTRTFGFV